MNYKQWLLANPDGTPIEYTKWCNTQNIVPNFRDANLEGVNLEGANLFYTNLERTNLKNANLERAILSWANLTDANLTGANLERTNLKNANLERAILSWANLTEAILRGANLMDANLASANLTGANLTYAHLFYTNLTSANFQDADLQDAILWDVELDGAIGIVPISGIGDSWFTTYFVKHKNSVKVLHEGFWGPTYEFIVRGYEYDTENSIPHDSPQSKGKAYRLASESAIFTLAQQQIKTRRE